MYYFLILKFINIFISLFLLVGARLAKCTFGVWLNPVSIFFLFWFFYIIWPLLVAFEVPVNPVAILYIVFFCYAFFISSIFFNWHEAFLQNKFKLSVEYYFDRRLVYIIFYFFSISAICLTIVDISIQEINVSLILSDPVSVGEEYSVKRYTGGIVKNIYSQVGLQICYYTAMLGGLLYGMQRSRQKRRCVLLFSFLPSFFIMLVQSAKGLFFFSIFLFLGSILITRIYRQNFNLISFGDFCAFCKYAALALPLVIVSFLSRGLSHSFYDASFVIHRLKYFLISYSSVHLPAFSDWFSERYFNDSLMHYNQEVFTWGFYTFMSIFRLFGDDRYVPIGTYDEYYKYGDIIMGNLYTIFRGLITDFGLLGSLFCGFLFGVLSNFFYWRLLNCRNNTIAIVFFVYFIAISYQSYTISSFTWLTIPFVFCTQCLMLYFLTRFKTI